MCKALEEEDHNEDDNSTDDGYLKVGVDEGCESLSDAAVVVVDVAR